MFLADPTCNAARDTPSRHVDFDPPPLGGAGLRLCSDRAFGSRRPRSCIAIKRKPSEWLMSLSLKHVTSWSRRYAAMSRLKAGLMCLSLYSTHLTIFVAPLLEQTAALPLGTTVFSIGGLKVLRRRQERSVRAHIGRCTTDRASYGGTHPR